MMNETKESAAPGWTLQTMSPPNETEALAISGFMLSSIADADLMEGRRQMTHWKLAKNPIHHGFASVMVTSDKQEIVSTCTTTLKRFWHSGKEQLWAEIGDTFTNESYQRKGMFSALVKSCRDLTLNAGVQVIYGLPNENSEPGYVNKLDFPIKKNIGLIDYSLVVGTSTAADRVERRWRNSRAVATLARACRHPLIDKIGGLPHRVLAQVQIPVGITVRSIDAFSSEFDGLWNRVRTSIPVCMIRDSKYLNWRFVDNPLSFRIYEARQKGSLEGYLVAFNVPGKNGEPGRLRIADWLFHPRKGQTIGAALLRHALLDPEKGRLRVVTALTSDKSPVQLPWRRFGFFVRPGRRPPVIIFNNEAGKRLIEDPTPWHFTSSDSDPF